MTPLQASLGGRKTPSELSSSWCQYAYVRRLTPPSSQAARRDQNRIAQREFRLRKQQRVMILSSPVFSGTSDDLLISVP
jgi:hypothetical protein